MDNNRNRNKIILFSCGSFNPPTLMHLRMFGKSRPIFAMYKFDHDVKSYFSMVLFVFINWLIYLALKEIARDYFHETEEIDVIGSIISPIHELYKKPNVTLASNEDRLAMMKWSLLSSNWIRLSDWETQQSHFTLTVDVLRYHQVSFRKF